MKHILSASKTKPQGTKKLLQTSSTIVSKDGARGAEPEMTQWHCLSLEQAIPEATH